MERSELEELINHNRSIRQIADELSKGYSTVVYWLKKHKLKTKSDFFRSKRKCKYCGTTKEKEFVTRSRGRLCRSVCKACHNHLRMERIRKYKEIAVNSKGGKCKKCGYDKCIGALEFHHKDPKKKDPNWKTIHSCSLDRILKEIKKCELLCANCHREKHWSHGEGRDSDG